VWERKKRPFRKKRKKGANLSFRAILTIFPTKIKKIPPF